MAQADEANQTFSVSIGTFDKLGRAWNLWGGFCDQACRAIQLVESSRSDTARATGPWHSERFFSLWCHATWAHRLMKLRSHADVHRDEARALGVQRHRLLPKCRADPSPAQNQGPPGKVRPMCARPCASSVSQLIWALIFCAPQG
jgi:hypothetical protein